MRCLFIYKATYRNKGRRIVKRVCPSKSRRVYATRIVMKLLPRCAQTQQLVLHVARYDYDRSGIFEKFPVVRPEAFKRRAAISIESVKVGNQWNAPLLADIHH